MAIDTAEKRRMALDFAQIRGTGMPIPSGMTSAPARAHILNLYFVLYAPSIVYFWRNKNRIVGSWVKQSVPSSSWRSKSSPSTSWKKKIPPPDGSTQEI